MTDGPPTQLEVDDLRKAFGANVVLDGVSFTATGGTITGLFGPNGAGKSTLFHVLMGLVRADGGRARLDGRDLLPLRTHEKAAAGLGLLPQRSRSFPELSVTDNLRAIVEVLPLARTERLARIAGLVELTGMEALARRRYATLSIGEQRRVELAKAFATRPRILLLDEPFAGLDPRFVDDVSTLLATLARGGVGIVLADHNVHHALRLVDRGLLLDRGRIVFDGTPAALVADDRAAERYLGRSYGSGARP
jgi:lipopolysaccharide export system ATP-binding protein